ncbi:hypothetical protein [Desulfonatronum thiodismutans]|uniref:hypothetical protein n=1 Tax=Desulfonatronum thiodismutans TaxID=159290 RepID=UPI0004ABEAA4|nr:hypothetical protein [Desulfonatronum thiodismutans]
MALSFGFDSKVVNSSIYNLAYCLPFLCAFYVMNAPENFELPFGFLVQGELASLFYIFAATFFYFLFIVFIALASHFSGLIEENKAWLFYVGLIFIISLIGIFKNEGQPKVSMYFTALSGIILLAYFFKKHNSSLSFAATSLMGAVACLLCFTSGVLWYFEHYIFIDAVKSALGLDSVKQESYKVGAVMLFSMGYVIYYGLFKLSETHQPAPNK